MVLGKRLIVVFFNQVTDTVTMFRTTDLVVCEAQEMKFRVTRSTNSLVFQLGPEVAQPAHRIAHAEPETCYIP